MNKEFVFYHLNTDELVILFGENWPGEGQCYFPFNYSKIGLIFIGVL